MCVGRLISGVGAGWLSLPQFYKASGYLTVGTGKLFVRAAALVAGFAKP